MALLASMILKTKGKNSARKGQSVAHGIGTQSALECKFFSTEERVEVQQ